MALNPKEKMSAWLYGKQACDDGAAWAGDQTLQEAWLTCPRPNWLLWALREAGLRDLIKDRRFACRCARDVWHLLTDPRSRNAVEATERLCEGLVTEGELGAAELAAWRALWRVGCAGIRNAARDAAHAAWHATYGSWDAARYAAWASVGGGGETNDGDFAAWEAASKVQADALRTIYGDPFATAQAN